MCRPSTTWCGTILVMLLFWGLITRELHSNTVDHRCSSYSQSYTRYRRGHISYGQTTNQDRLLYTVHIHQVIEFSRVFTHTPRIYTHVHIPNWKFLSLQGPPNFHTRGIYKWGSLYIRGQTIRGPGKGPWKDKMSSVIWSNATTWSSVWMQYKYTHTETDFTWLRPYMPCNVSCWA